MAADYLWAWNSGTSTWIKVAVDANGKLIISDVDPFTVQQTTPQNLKHVPHGYYPTGGTYLPYQVDSAGKLLLSIAALQHLSDIADVNLTGLTTEDFIYWNASTSKWERIAHKDATTGVHGVGAATIAKSTDTLWNPDISCRVHAVAAQTFANLAWAACDFGTGKGVEDYDTDAIHDMTTNPTRLTCKTAGKYLIFGMGQFAVSATGSAYFALCVNGIPGVGLNLCNDLKVLSATFGAAGVLSTMTVLAINNYIELALVQDSGGNLNTVWQGVNLGMIKVAQEVEQNEFNVASY